MDLQREILDAARRLLIATGYERLSMRRIAREIGISATTIYLYFNNKDALFEALVDEGMESLYTTLSAIRAEAASAGEAFEGMCRGYVSFGLANPEYYEIMFVLRSEAMSRFPAEKYRRARRNLELIGQVIEELTTAEEELALIRATAAWASLHGIVSLLLARRIDTHVNHQDVIDHTIARLCAEVLQPVAEASLRRAPESQKQSIGLQVTD